MALISGSCLTVDGSIGPHSLSSVGGKGQLAATMPAVDLPHQQGAALGIEGDIVMVSNTLGHNDLRPVKGLLVDNLKFWNDL